MTRPIAGPLLRAFVAECVSVGCAPDTAEAELLEIFDTLDLAALREWNDAPVGTAYRPRTDDERVVVAELTKRDLTWLAEFVARLEQTIAEVRKP